MKNTNRINKELLVSLPTSLTDMEQYRRNSIARSNAILAEAQKQLEKQRKEHAPLLKKAQRHLARRRAKERS